MVYVALSHPHHGGSALRETAPVNHRCDYDVLAVHRNAIENHVGPQHELAPAALDLPPAKRQLRQAFRCLDEHPRDPRGGGWIVGSDELSDFLDAGDCGNGPVYLRHRGAGSSPGLPQDRSQRRTFSCGTTRPTAASASPRSTASRSATVSGPASFAGGDSEWGPHRFIHRILAWIGEFLG
jgi:hypothetical protein